MNYSNNIIDDITKNIKPVIEKLGYELYFIEYTKEDEENYLRVYIDVDRGVNIEDCELVSRSINLIIDEMDPYEENYFFEVSSPGIFRQIHNDEHLKKYIKEKIKLNLNKQINGKKSIVGELVDFCEDYIEILSLSNGKKESLKVSRDAITKINLEPDINFNIEEK